MDILNNREIAILVWSLGTFGFLVIKAKAWPALLGLVRSFCKPLILQVVAAMAVYVAASVWVLAQANLWAFANLKTTLVWFFSFALGWMMNLRRWDKDPNDDLKASLKEVLSLTTVVVFVTEFYTLSLVGELILVPVLSFVAIMAAVSRSLKGAEAASRLFNGLLPVLGFGLLGYAAWRLAGDLQGFATPETGREFVAPALLSLMFVPFMYAVNIYSAYMTTFRILPIGLKDRRLAAYAFRRAAFSFGLDVQLLRRWKTAVFNAGAATREDIDSLISTMKEAKRVERRPPTIPAEEGWCPQAARGWLKMHGLQAGPYNPLYMEWGASSPYHKLGEGVIADNLAYYVRGTARAATRLTLILSKDVLRQEEETPTASREAFAGAMDALLSGALGEKADRARRGLNNRRHRTHEGFADIELSEDEYRIKLTITHVAHVEPF